MRIAAQLLIAVNIICIIANLVCVHQRMTHWSSVLHAAVATMVAGVLGWSWESLWRRSIG